MSHFFTVVLVPENIKNIEEKITELLEPYDENMNVGEYDRKCYCIGTIAQSDSWKSAEEKFGAFETLRNSFWDKVQLQMPSNLKNSDNGYWEKREEVAGKLNWEKHTEHFTTYAKSIEEAHKLYKKSDPNCSECNGTGTHKSTYNPSSKWDWWVIGGRWDGVIQNKERNSDNGFNFGDQHHQLAYNTISAKELLEALQKDTQCPYSLVTPNGEWCQRGEMGWFGISIDEKADNNWNDIVKKVLEKHYDCIAVGCDLHI